ncbi:MAG: hypothetical protein IPN26_09375 [Bacteroidetes bacterium]|nr:hypothetical protein [Bacteroidota bacterium]
MVLIAEMLEGNAGYRLFQAGIAENYSEQQLKSHSDIDLCFLDINLQMNNPDLMWPVLSTEQNTFLLCFSRPTAIGEAIAEIPILNHNLIYS